MSAPAAVLRVGPPAPTPVGTIALVAAVSVGVLCPRGPLADLLVAFVTALPAVAYVLCWRVELRKLEVRRRLPSTATKGEALSITHEVRHPGRRLIRDLVLTEDHPGGGGSSATFFAALLPGARGEARARMFAAQRGHLPLERLRAVAGDPFGLFVRVAHLRLATEVLVHPKPARSAAALALGLARRQGAVGSPETEWVGVREGRTGDPLRLVHWPLSARRGAPVVRVAARTRPMLGHVVLDRRPPVGAGRGSQAFEKAVSLAAGVVLELLARGIEVDLRIPGAPGEDDLVVEGLRGREGGGQALDVLALVTPSAADGPPPRAPAGALVVTAREELRLPRAVVLSADAARRQRVGAAA